MRMALLSLGMSVTSLPPRYLPESHCHMSFMSLPAHCGIHCLSILVAAFWERLQLTLVQSRLQLQASVLNNACHLNYHACQGNYAAVCITCDS